MRSEKIAPNVTLGFDESGNIAGIAISGLFVLDDEQAFQLEAESTADSQTQIEENQARIDATIQALKERAEEQRAEANRLIDQQEHD